MLDVPLQLLIALVGAFACSRRGNRPWVALVKSVLLSLAATTLLSLTFWITS